MKQQTWMRVAAIVSCLVLVIAMAGCADTPVPTSPAETTESNAVGTTDPTEALHYDPSTWPKLQPYSQAPIIETDSDREVYISLKNQSCDFYPEVVYNGVAFDIITKEYFQPDEIQVVFPGKTKCEIRVTERNEEFQNIALNQFGSYNTDGQQPYHYLCLQDVDLYNLGQQSSDANYAAAAYSLLVQSNQTTAEDYTVLMEGYINPYQTLYQGYMEAYANQTQQRVTDYNAYSVNLIFDQEKYVEETIEYIDIMIGDSTYHVEFGQWRIHAEPLEESTQTNKGVSLSTVAILGASGDSPYAEGYMKIEGAIRFHANEDMILTGLRCSNAAEVQILGAQIEITSAGSSMNYYWNGVDPVTVDNGSDLTMTVYLYSEKFQEYEMSMTSILHVDYALSSTGAEFSLAIPCKISRYNRLWDTYCLAFLGVDVGEYYHYFHDTIWEVSWIKEIPESWQTK